MGKNRNKMRFYTNVIVSNISVPLFYSDEQSVPLFEDIEIEFNERFKYIKKLGVISDKEYKILEMRVLGENSLRGLQEELGISYEAIRMYQDRAEKRLKILPSVFVLFTKGIEECDGFIVKHNKLNKNKIFTPITELGLKRKTYDALKHHKILTVGELLIRSRKDLLKLKGLGNVLVEDIEYCLNKYDLHLKVNT